MDAGYFPNSRTRIQAFASINNSLYKVRKRNLYEFRPSAGLNMSYFLNYRMRLTADVVAHYFWTSDDYARIFRPSFIPLPERSGLQTLSRIEFAYSVF